jgi:hypothetical protein
MGVGLSGQVQRIAGERPAAHRRRAIDLHRTLPELHRLRLLGATARSFHAVVSIPETPFYDSIHFSFDKPANAWLP